MKHLNRWMSLVLTLVMMVSMVVLPGAGCAESDSGSSAVYFEPSLVQVLDISARDFMKSDDMRALLAVVLSFEFYLQETDYEMDYLKPIYIAIRDSALVTLALGLEDGYVCIFYSDLTDPVTTAYSVMDDTSSSVMKLALEVSNTSVWEVPWSDYYEQATELREAFDD